jgi:hypothetical protein
MSDNILPSIRSSVNSNERSDGIGGNDHSNIIEKAKDEGR